jgi:uncharacterized protein (DUF4415 family)
MPKTNEEYGILDAENPEWTKERFARAKRIDQLPSQMQTLLRARKRGPQKAPTKILTALRLSPDVLEALRGTGRGWQSRVDETLRKAYVTAGKQTNG